MRLLLIISAFAAASAELTHTLRGLQSTTYPKCTSATTKLFKDNLSAASDGCTVTKSYVWDGTTDPTAMERADLCKCTVSSFSVPKCYWTKLGQYDVTTAQHFNFVYDCASSSGKTTPKVTEVDATTVTATLAPTTTTATPTLTTVTPTTTLKPTTTTASPTLGTSSPATATSATPPIAAPVSEADSSSTSYYCTMQQVSTFTSDLNTASNGCVGSSSYNWGGSKTPTETEYSEICKCASVGAFTIPTCSVQKGAERTTLADHYNSVRMTQCPTFKPTAVGAGGEKKSASNIGVIAVIAGGVVVLLLIIALVMCKRNRNASEKQDQYQAHDPASSPVAGPAKSTTKAAP